MDRHIRLLFSLAALLMLLLAVIFRPASADGIPVEKAEWDPNSDIEMPAQKAILIYDEQSQREDLILSIELRGGPEAAWVVPVPSLPEVETASPDWFEQLSDRTRPIVEHRTKTIYGRAGEMTVVETVEVEVEVISREEVGVYDVSILSANKPGALIDWLNENGYAFPEQGEPLLDTCMEEGGWYFVAARPLAGGASARLDGDVHPLWFSFETERPINPMRLTTLVKRPLHVLIYVLADHRMEIPGHRFDTEFAGELTLKPVNAENAEAVELLTQRRYYVTKLRKENLYPPNWTEDIYFEQSANDEPYHKVLYETEYRYVYVQETKTPPPPTQAEIARETDTLPTQNAGEGLAKSLDDNGNIGWLGLGLMLGLVGALIALGYLWRRRSRRKPEGEEEA